MLGAIIGDIVGSVYEHASHKSKNFPLFEPQCRPTDDSIMTIAIGCACTDTDCRDEEEFKRAVCNRMRELGRQYPYAGYGGNFYRWLMEDDAPAYGSFANGSAMRVSPVAWVARSLEEAERLAQWSAEVTHNHPDGIKGAQAVAAAIYMARTGASQEEIGLYIHRNYYPLNFSLDSIRPYYHHEISCERSVPQAIRCFLEATDYEDTIRNAISLGGDCDTQAAIAGSITEAFFGIPEEIQEEAFTHMDETLTDYYLSYAEELYD